MNNMTKEQRGLASKYESVYIDANCFIYASLSEEGVSEKARKILEQVKNGFYKKAFTSTLTVDEFIWRIQKEVGRDLASEGAGIFFNLENLELISVDTSIMLNALDNYKKEKLDPRDAIHLATMQSKNIKAIISSDPDFDKVKGIKRINFSK